MSHFTEREIAYLHTQRLGRLATVGSDDGLGERGALAEQESQLIA